MENPEAFSEESFQNMTLQLQKLTPYVNELSNGIENIVALVGATGVGKSTLASYLKGVKLIYQKYGGGKYQINHQKYSEDLPKIGHQNQSCTTLPGVYKDGEKAFVDLAGWFDTRAPSQEILNSISNSLIFNPGKKVKILIVIQVQELNALRGGLLVQIANRLIKFFEDDFTKMIKSIILVISKVNTDQWSLPDIQKNITKICEKNQNLMQNTRSLLYQLINQKRIAIFPRPDKIQNHIDIIRDLLKNSRPTILSHKGCITLSEKAINVVNKCVSFLNSDIYQLGKAFAQDIQKAHKYRQFKSGIEVNQVINKLKTSSNIVQSQFQQAPNFEKQISLLNEFGSMVQVNKKICDKMNKIFTMIRFYSSLHKNIKLDFSFVCVISGKMKQLIYALQVKRISLTSEEDRQRMQKEFKQSMKEREAQNNQQFLRIQQANKASQKALQDVLTGQKNLFQAQMKNRKAQKQKMEKQIQAIRAQNKRISYQPPPPSGRKSCNLI